PRVLDVAEPVPDVSADIMLVVQNAGAALGMTPDRRVAPTPAAGPRNAIGVQPAGDRPGRFAGDEFPDDPPHDAGLLFIDYPAAADQLSTRIMLSNDVVPVA